MQTKQKELKIFTQSVETAVIEHWGIGLLWHYTIQEAYAL